MWVTDLSTQVSNFSLGRKSENSDSVIVHEQGYLTCLEFAEQEYSGYQPGFWLLSIQNPP